MLSSVSEWMTLDRNVKRNLLGVALIGLVSAACGFSGSSNTAAASTKATTTLNVAVVEADIQALKHEISNADTQLQLDSIVSCSTASDMQSLQNEVNSSQWAQAAYYATAVKSDIITEQSEFSKFLAEFPAQKQNFSGLLPFQWSAVIKPDNQLLSILPQVTVAVQGNC